MKQIDFAHSIPFSASEPRKLLLFIMGASGSGKTCFLANIKELYQDRVHLVRAPLITSSPDKLFAGIKKGASKGAQFILVDGQPSNVEQARKILEWIEIPEYERAVVELVCPRQELNRRRSKRFPITEMIEPDQSTSDIHEVLIEFSKYHIHRFNSHHPNYTPGRAFEHVLKTYN